MSADLDEAIYELLEPARGVIDRHTRDERSWCGVCHKPWPCFEFGTALGAVDLVLRVHAAIRRQEETGERDFRPTRPVPIHGFDPSGVGRSR